LSLIVEGLTIDHGAIRAINNVSFKVPQGQLAAVIGSNGAGKTTLLRTLSGLKEASSGSATWNASPILGKRAEDLARSGIMHVSDGKSVIAELSVKDIVEQIFQTIKSFVKSMNLTVVLVEQNAMGALKIADQGIVLNLGSVVLIDSAEKLLNDPAVRSAYLGF